MDSQSFAQLEQCAAQLLRSEEDLESKEDSPGAVQTVTPSEWIRVTIVYLSVPLILLV